MKSSQDGEAESLAKFNDLYNENHDFSPAESPSARVMLAALPRSGSNFLALNLWRTGLVGAPLEYLNIALRRHDMIERLGGGDPIQYWSKLREIRSSPNGVFSFKAFTSDYKQIALQCPDLLPYVVSDKVISLTRGDKLAQAISWTRARQSRQWSSIGAGEHSDTYDRKAIDSALWWVRSFPTCQSSQSH